MPESVNVHINVNDMRGVRSLLKAEGFEIHDSYNKDNKLLFFTVEATLYISETDYRQRANISDKTYSRDIVSIEEERKKVHECR